MSPGVEMLKRALEDLAADADAQLGSLRRQGCIPPELYIDELALDYDAIAMAAEGMLLDGELDEPACDAVESLNRYLSSISGRENARLWTEKALRHSPEWQKARSMATHCLAMLRSSQLNTND